MKETNRRNIWVLGATGYVGQLVSRRLFSGRLEGDWSGQLITMGNRRIIPWLMERTNFHLYPLAAIPTSLFNAYPPQQLYHCARMAGTSDRSRRKAARKGNQANRRLVSLLREKESPTTLVYCSGTLMYGNTNGVIDESAALQPTAYARAYEYAERPWTEASAAGDLDVRIARPAWILGPDSWFEHFFFLPAIQNGSVPIYGDGQQQMSIISVEDCAGQLTHLMNHGTPNQHANLFGFEPITQQEFAALVADSLGLTTTTVTADTTLRKHGKTVCEALTSNTPVTTQHKAWRSSYTPVHKDLKALISGTVDKLQAKHRNA